MSRQRIINFPCVPGVDFDLNKNWDDVQLEKTVTSSLNKFLNMYTAEGSAINLKLRFLDEIVSRLRQYQTPQELMRQFYIDYNEQRTEVDDNSVQINNVDYTNEIQLDKWFEKNLSLFDIYNRVFYETIRVSSLYKFDSFTDIEHENLFKIIKIVSNIDVGG